MDIYVELFNGRKDPAEELDDWGEQGPIFGPFHNVTSTYATDVKMNHGMGVHRLLYSGEYVYYDGVYYGDWAAYTNLTDKMEPRLVPFDRDKAEPPAPADERVVITLEGAVVHGIEGPESLTSRIEIKHLDDWYEEEE